MAFPGRVFPILLFLHVLSKPSMGLWDSLVYGSVSAVVKLRLKLGRRTANKRAYNHFTIRP